MSVQKFKIETIEGIAKILGDKFKGSEIAELLITTRITDITPNDTKWKRLKLALEKKQEDDKCANNIVEFLKRALSPSRHFDNEDWFNEALTRINMYLSIEGYEFKKNGEIVIVKKATTIQEAKERANRFKNLLQQRKVHGDIFKYCGDEINSDNYFHVVFEATKSVFDKIREKTSLNADGSDLVDMAFAVQGKMPIPHLALSSLTTESEKSEQRGFMNLIKGLYGAFRNPIAHEVKIKWTMTEQDALDALALISFTHRKLDTAIEARRIYENKAR